MLLIRLRPLYLAGRWRRASEKPGCNEIAGRCTPPALACDEKYYMSRIRRMRLVPPEATKIEQWSSALVFRNQLVDIFVRLARLKSGTAKAVPLNFPDSHALPTECCRHLITF